ncbi:MAG: hypothetical protein OHK0013_18750 [Sandaracinaceae bacterium]
MISDDVRIQGFDARAFTNLVSLFAPNVVWRNERDPQDSDAPELDEHVAEERRAADGSLVVVVSAKGTVRKAFHTVRGRVRDFQFEGWDRLAGVPERYGARRVVVLREGALEELVARASQRMHREDDYLAQWLHVVRAVREEIDSGRLAIHPRPFVSVPLPTPQLVRRTMDSVLPDDRTFVLAVWRGSALWTSAVLRRRAGEIDWIAGPDQLLAWTGPLGGDWRRDHRIVSQAVAAHVAPVHLGIYGELRSIRKLLRSREPGAWARAVASREVIVSPTPPYVAVALGADAMRRVARKSTELLGGLDPLRRLTPVLGLLRGRVAEVASVTQALGFDPLKLLAQFLQRVDPLEQAGEESGAVDERGAPAYEAVPLEGEAYGDSEGDYGLIPNDDESLDEAAETFRRAYDDGAPLEHPTDAFSPHDGQGEHDEDEPDGAGAP